ncbi:Protein YIPF3 [Trichinella sp. T9]|nr:Protein YIPF3 [Trichinella sp. T9]
MEPPLKVSSRYAAGDFVSEGEIHSSKVEKNDTGQQFNANLTKMVFDASSEHIKKAVSIYINVDFLRPYFDVTPVEVVHRLLNSVLPMKRKIGYSMFSHCIVLAITEIVHLLFHSHYFFHFCALTIGSMAAGKLVVYFFHGAYRNWDRCVLVAVVLFLHMGFLYYLHFGFHRVVEEITEILGEDVSKVALLITTTTVGIEHTS